MPERFVNDSIVEVIAMKDKIEIINYPNCTEYLLNDKLHREDGPAREWANGYKEWYIRGECHRTDGPAIDWADGNKKWYIDGKLHREDGPAIEWNIRTKSWYIHGKLHREDGPARELANGYKEYWYNGYRIDMLNGNPIEIDANLFEIDVMKYLLTIQALR